MLQQLMYRSNSHLTSLFCLDDTPVASAKAGPCDGSGDVDEEGNTNNGRLWRTVIIGEQEHRIDMQVIRPYVRVITHGGQSKEKLFLFFVLFFQVWVTFKHHFTVT